MIREFVNIWDEHKDDVEQQFRKKKPEWYKDVVTAVITMLYKHGEEHLDYGNRPTPQRIHEIDDGHYQGTLLYVIGDEGYQPDTYWYVFVDYGSCSGCDTLEAIHAQSYEDIPTDEQLADYMTLALHIIQGLTKIEWSG